MPRAEPVAQLPRSCRSRRSARRRPAVLVADRLVARVEVDDRQPPRGEADRALADRPVGVGPAVDERRAHRLQRATVGRRRPSSDEQPGDAAHPSGPAGLQPPAGDEARRLADHRDVERDRAVGDVLEVVGELLPPVISRRQPQLREAGDARAHDQPLPVGGDLLDSSSKKVGRIGRGPTRLMSPRRTFHSCGSSSRWKKRRSCRRASAPRRQPPSAPRRSSRRCASRRRPSACGTCTS